MVHQHPLDGLRRQVSAGGNIGGESLQLFRTFEITEIVILLVTVGVIVYTHNLAIGIILGVLLSGLLYHFFKKEPKKSC